MLGFIIITFIVIIFIDIIIYFESWQENGQGKQQVAAVATPKLTSRTQSTSYHWTMLPTIITY